MRWLTAKKIRKTTNDRRNETVQRCLNDATTHEFMIMRTLVHTGKGGADEYLGGGRNIGLLTLFDASMLGYLIQAASSSLFFDTSLLGTSPTL
jgi:hypothetical protein